MEYGKPFGAIGGGGGAAALGFSTGHGWLVVGSVSVTAIGIILIRLFFRRSKQLGGF